MPQPLKLHATVRHMRAQSKREYIWMVQTLVSHGYQERHVKPCRLKMPDTFIRNDRTLQIFWTEPVENSDDEGVAIESVETPAQ